MAAESRDWADHLNTSLVFKCHSKTRHKVLDIHINLVLQINVERLSRSSLYLQCTCLTWAQWISNPLVQFSNQYCVRLSNHTVLYFYFGFINYFVSNYRTLVAPIKNKRLEHNIQQRSQNSLNVRTNQKLNDFLVGHELSIDTHFVFSFQLVHQSHQCGHLQGFERKIIG